MNRPSNRIAGLVTVLAATLALGQPPGNLEALFEKVDPAVVTIRVGFKEEKKTDKLMVLKIEVGTGAGVLLHESGFVVTAAHVVDQAVAIIVEFSDGTQVPADIVTLSRTEDLALLKVDDAPKGVVPPPLGDSDKLKVGQGVFAIGTPLGFKHSLTAGLVSGIRKGPPQGLLPQNVIQTDAALNQGNSGGALFNDKGEVIGIASYIATLNGGSMGLGFVIPSNLVRRRLFEQALPYLGVSLRVIPKDVCEVFNWPVETALLVERVKEGSAAAEAGLRGGEVTSDIGGSPLQLGGDLIVKVGPYETSQLDKIGQYLHGLKEGDKLKYGLLRAGKLMEVEVVIPALTPIPSLKPGAKAAKR